jgi:alanyl-tRNA synthetase
LRFDFANSTAVSPQELFTIERETNQRIAAAAEITAETLPLAEAQRLGAMMLFGEKYPDPVRMVSIGEFSRELCGGTHLDNTDHIEAFEIISEESVSAGTRRIEALTGQRAKDHQRFVNETVERIAKTLTVDPSRAVDAVRDLMADIRDLKKRIASGKVSSSDGQTATAPAGGKLDYYQRRDMLRALARQLNVPTQEVADRVVAMRAEALDLRRQLESAKGSDSIDAEGLVRTGESISGIRLIVQHIPVASPVLMRELIDQVRRQAAPVAVFLATTQATDKVLLVAGLSRDLVEKGLSAGEWVKEVAPIVGGGGGGKPDLAQAGGKQPENIQKALAAAREFIRGRVIC